GGAGGGCGAPPRRAGGSEHAGLAPVAEDLADEPFRASDRPLRHGRAVGQPARALLELPARDLGRVPDPRRPRVAELVRVEALTRLEVAALEPGRAHPVEPERALAVARAVPRVHVPVRQPPFERVRLAEGRPDLLFAFLQVVDLDEAPLAQAAAERADEVLLGALHLRLRRLLQLELAEGLLEFRAHAVERRARVCSDHRAHELERQADRPRLERRQARWRPEGVAPELLVDADRVAVELGVDRVAAAAEVDEVEQREVLLEPLER